MYVGACHGVEVLLRALSWTARVVGGELIPTGRLQVISSFQAKHVIQLGIYGYIGAR